jgi:hypothetical protein
MGHEPYSAQHGAIHHTGETGFLFTVFPPHHAKTVADALNRAACAEIEQAQALELIFFGSETLAHKAGFTAIGRRHRDFASMEAWWPNLDPETLRGVKLSRVTVTEAAQRAVLEDPEHRFSKALQRAFEIAWGNLRVAPKLWIAL